MSMVDGGECASGSSGRAGVGWPLNLTRESGLYLTKREPGNTGSVNTITVKGTINTYVICIPVTF
jgi:hypothetical protein